MRVGAWHQMGDRSQRLVLEQIQAGRGAGVVVSPRDLPLPNAIGYAEQYRDLGAELLLDLQFYFPEFTNDRLDTYPPQRHRAAISQLANLSSTSLQELSTDIATVSRDLHATGVLAPALLYQAARPDISQSNARLFISARRAADDLGLPCYATVFLARSATSSDNTMFSALSDATALSADGWYYGYEFPPERIPSAKAETLRCAAAGLTLACTGKPVFHAYAGPMAIVSPCFGASATGIGHFQNTWSFNPGRWKTASDQGGGGEAPPRFFSTTLWGTIVYPDEVFQLPQPLRTQILSISPYSANLSSPQPSPWSRWDANKHLVYAQVTALQDLFAAATLDEATGRSSAILSEAVSIHAQIAATGLHLRDATSSYQANWLGALNDLHSQHDGDFQYLEMIS